MLHVQRFTVPYEYPVYFGRGVFSSENCALVDAVSRREPARRHRVAVVVEERVSSCWPALVPEIARYAERHAPRLSLAEAPLVVPGGEACKADPRAPQRIGKWLDA